MKEQVSEQILEEGFKKILNRIKTPNHSLTIHRDGIFYEAEQVKNLLPRLGIKKFNLVEVVKSGTPVIGFHSDFTGQPRYLDGFEGYYVYRNNISYLITNDQCLTTQTAPVPICIKKIHGYRSIIDK